jgi:UDP-2-acetamido-2,6-beta-L-arabino-hexul-4-ose reductase
MNIAITGADGFLGKNLIYQLYKREKININKITRNTKIEDLDKIILNSKFIYHFAGANRPKSNNGFITDNINLTKYICDLLIKNKSKNKIIFTSSTQAENKTKYGHSKKKCEKIIINYAKKNKAGIYIYRLPNIFGKWSKPNYNSVVSTFCHNISRNKKIIISNPKKKIDLIYVDDVIESFMKIITSKSTPQQNFYKINKITNISLMDLSNTIKEFHLDRKEGLINDISLNFRKKLYSTYVSFLPKKAITYKLISKIDKRGSFTEFLKTKHSGQISVFTAKKNITRGQHFHHTKVEKFFVVKGKAKFYMRNLLTNKIINHILNSETPKVIESLPGYTHYIKNIGKEDLIVLLWSNEVFNVNKPDTFHHE